MQYAGALFESRFFKDLLISFFVGIALCVFALFVKTDRKLIEFLISE